MARVCRLQGDGAAFGIPYLADHDDIRGFPEYVPQPLFERIRVDPDFPLVDVARFVLMKILYWVFDGNDIAFSLRVDNVDQCSHCRGLPMPNRPGDQNEPLLFKCEILDP